MNKLTLTRTLAVLVPLLALAAASAKEKKASPDSGEYRPAIDPAKFTHVVTHP